MGRGCFQGSCKMSQVISKRGKLRRTDRLALFCKIVLQLRHQLANPEYHTEAQASLYYILRPRKKFPH